MPPSTSPILYESHMHTELCKHSKGTPDEYAAVAVARGLKGMTVTCHCPLPDGINAVARMAPEEMATYVELVAATTARWRERLDVRLGLESDYAPQFTGWLERLHASENFSYILGSVHPHAGYYRKRYETGDLLEFRRTYFTHLADAAETGLFDCLSHPDLVKNIQAKKWNFEAVRPHVARCLDRIAHAGTAMELNTSGLYKTVREYNPGRSQLEMMYERGIPVVLGADAHQAHRVGDQFPEALDLLADIGYRTVSIFRDRRREEIAIDRARASLVLTAPTP